MLEILDGIMVVTSIQIELVWSLNSNFRYTKDSGVGSLARSNTFKNAIVGAAAGHLIYQGGKHMIRSAMAPMM